jgi:hypothetical protein
MWSGALWESRHYLRVALFHTFNWNPQITIAKHPTATAFPEVYVIAQ